MKVLCTICARGGSQGVKNKNIILLKNKPLIAHSILQAKRAGIMSVIGVSSDSDMILNVAKEWGVDFTVKRPAELASSTAGKLPAIQHAVTEIEKMSQQHFDVVIDLDATSPLRSVEDIQQAYIYFMSHKSANNLVTAYPSRRSPYFNMLELNQHGYVQLSKKPDISVIRRQDAPASYDMNASIYIWKRDTLFSPTPVINDQTILYVMPEERSIDIDSKLDLKFVRLLARNRKDLD